MPFHLTKHGVPVLKLFAKDFRSVFFAFTLILLTNK
jgi:hypothetical protein